MKASTTLVGTQQSIQHSPSVISHHKSGSPGSCEMPVACVCVVRVREESRETRGEGEGERTVMRRRRFLSREGCRGRAVPC